MTYANSVAPSTQVGEITTSSTRLIATSTMGAAGESNNVFPSTLQSASSTFLSKLQTTSFTVQASASTVANSHSPLPSSIDPGAQLKRTDSGEFELSIGSVVGIVVGAIFTLCLIAVSGIVGYMVFRKKGCAKNLRQRGECKHALFSLQQHNNVGTIA